MTNYIRNGTVDVDHIEGGYAGDFVTSNLYDGNDTFTGWYGSCLVYGGAGDDTISTGAEGGTAYGGIGSDYLWIFPSSTDADHTLYGDAGNDWLETGGSGSGTINLFGGIGFDGFIDTRRSGTDIFAGGTGFDFAEHIEHEGYAAGVTVSLATGVGNRGAAGNSYVSVEGLRGTRYGDVLTGDSTANVLVGGDSSDQLSGGDGNDLLIGQNFEKFFLNFTGQSATVKGANPFSYSDSGAFIDRLDDGAADTLLGGEGNDVLLGGGGADRLSGGTGLDTASYVDSYAVFVNLATGAAQGNDATGDVLTGIENLLGSHWNDNLTGDGGNNVLTGSGGNDTLRGGAGQDRLVGDEGADRLYGGGGADRFVFEVALDSPFSGGDTILDFSAAGGDMIDLRAIDALPGGADNALLFRGSSAFTDTGQVRTFQSEGNTIVAVNLTGGATPEMRITLAGLHTLTGDDFIL